MKTLGLLGGMSWESTTLYYQALNRLVRDRLGGMHSAQLLIWSADFQPIADMQAAGDWEGATALLAAAARSLEVAGAEAILICSNTMHLKAEAIQAAIGVPLLHIGDATASAIVEAGLKRPLLLGTRFTMEQAFYRDRLAAHGLAPKVPREAERGELHRIIYDELVRGVVTEPSRQAVLATVERARLQDGVDGVIFGCTEIGMLIGQGDLDLPVFDTTLIHAGAAAAFALQ